MRLLIEKALATAPFRLPIELGWFEPSPPWDIEIRRGLRGEALGGEEFALLSAAEVLACQATHLVVPAAAVVADGEGDVAMRTPVRPDAIERTPIRLLETSGSAELLARAILRPFYGIEATVWVTDEAEPTAADAQVVIVEGEVALRRPELGFSEDLCRAWLILVDRPAVTHVLVAPRASAMTEIEHVVSVLADLHRIANERRRAWRSQIADQHGLDRSRLDSFLAHQRYRLDPAARDGLLLFLRRGSPGSSYPAPTAIDFWAGREEGHDPI
jgi:predicted solute-binding protein